MHASLPARGAWIEIRLFAGGRYGQTSLPARGAWIEIYPDAILRKLADVAPRTGSVD